MRIALAFLLTGCVAIPDGLDHDSSSSDPTTPPSPIALGTYHVHSNIDLTVEALLPEPAADTVVTLRSFSTDPGATLLDLAADAGVPAVQEIRDALPSYVESELEGWIDGEIAKLTIDGTPITQVAGDIAALAETALTQFSLDSELSVAGAAAQHDLAMLDLRPAGFDVTFSLDDLPAEIVSATTTCSSSRTTFSIGDHGYSLPYGEYVWRAMNATMVAQHGVDLRGALGAAVDCPSLAQRIAAKCVWSYCVGHEAALTEICEAGLDEVVDRAHAKLAEMKFDAIHFAAGSATLVDTNGDHVAERLDAGVWTAEINAGLGLRHVPATFTAVQ